MGDTRNEGEISEQGIVARVRSGEIEAYAALVRAYTAIAHRTAVLLGAGADAEDVVQSAFVKAYLALGRFEEGAAFRPWLLRIVANETKNTIRATVRLRCAVGREAAMSEAEPLIPDSADPAGRALAGERRERLLAAIDQLSEPQRQVVTYRYLLDLDEAETAEVLGWPRGTVKSRLSRALRSLERLLSDSVCDSVGDGNGVRDGGRGGGGPVGAGDGAAGEGRGGAGRSGVRSGARSGVRSGPRGRARGRAARDGVRSGVGGGVRSGTGGTGGTRAGGRDGGAEGGDGEGVGGEGERYERAAG